MATLEEINSIYTHTTDGAQVLENKIASAVLKQAEAIRVDASPPANQAARLAWAKRAFVSPGEVAREMFGALLAANASATVSQIINAADPTIETAVANAVNVFADTA